MKDGKPYMAVGSPGGSRIIGFVAKTLVAHIDWGMDIQAAISLPNMLNRGSQYEIEEKTAAADKAAALEKLGYKSPSPRFEFRRTRHCDRQRRFARRCDPRREGKVMGRLITDRLVDKRSSEIRKISFRDLCLAQTSSI